ncbi:Terpene synthase, N-terminal domain containing protein, partial [Parasponia andersonii]
RRGEYLDSEFKDHLLENERIKEARDFTKEHLEEYMKWNKVRSDDDLVILVGHALELPLHWRMLRMEARNPLTHMERDMSRIPLFLSSLNLISTWCNQHI